MVIKPNVQIALMSIHPKFANRILSGEKRVEFRKKGFGENVQYVVIYATNPVQKVVGVFEVADVIQDSPDELWNRYEDVAGVELEFYQQYFLSRDTGIAIEVGDVIPLEEPILLSDIDQTYRPPQSYRYIESEKVANLLYR